MFQSFQSTTSPNDGPPRLAALRAEMAQEGLDCFLVPRADKHQGEYVAPCDERLAWLTGFTGSAGFAAVASDVAGVFVDGRYRLQVRAQVAEVFTPVDWPEVQLGPWLMDNLPEGSKVGFDPWLETAKTIETLQNAVGDNLSLVPVENLVDRIWKDRPAPPAAPAKAHPEEFAGKTSKEKRDELSSQLTASGQTAAILTLPDSICWLLNIRGADIPRIPIMQALAILYADGEVDLFVDPAKVDALGLDVTVHPPEAFSDALMALSGPVRVDKSTAPIAVSTILEEAGVAVAWGDDPCLLAKACKNDVEIAGTREAHLRDGAAMVEFLCWLDNEAPKGALTEISAAQQLETCRRATNALQDISFDTISGAGPNGAIIHYRVTEETNRPLQSGELYLVDSGGQYLNGTTDITRTVAVGTPPPEAVDAFTRVLQGMIAISTARFPRGLAGRDLDPLARSALWRGGYDFDHGTGHGVGSYLSVHEGPQGLSRRATVPLKPGMILSNEPGYYRPGEFGIRIENLIVVIVASEIGDKRDQLGFETVTFVPIDRRLIDVSALAPWEKSWLDRYHAEVREKIGPRVSEKALQWLEQATAPL